MACLQRAAELLRERGSRDERLGRYFRGTSKPLTVRTMLSETRRRVPPEHRLSSDGGRPDSSNTLSWWANGLDAADYERGVELTCMLLERRRLPRSR